MTLSQSREIAVPFHFDDTGAVASVSRLEDVILGHIRTIVLTAETERVMVPQFGAGARNLLFEHNDLALSQGLSALIADNLKRWEPGINIRGVDVVPHPVDEGVLEIRVLFSSMANPGVVEQVAFNAQGQVTNG